MSACPCCANPMLRHIRHHQTYWFCRSCWQEMPILHASLNLVSASLEQQFLRPSFPPSLAVN